MPPRVYDHQQLDNVIADLERNGVIPLGTTWEAEALKSRRVSASFWFLPTDRDALARIAESAAVAFKYPMGQHGQIVGSIVVSEAVDGEPRLLPRFAKDWQPPVYANRRKRVP
jgi:hypothetical protein